MKVSFKSRKLETLETQAGDAGYAAEAVRAFRKRMQFLRAAKDERDLHGMRSLHFKRLNGPRSHQFSLRLNDQWRLILEMEEDGPSKTLTIIEIEDYH
jgi:proteic killer suppression protein